MAGLSRLVRPGLAVVFFMGGYLANKMHFATKMVQGVEREKILGLLSFETSLKEFYVKEAQEVRCQSFTNSDAHGLQLGSTLLTMCMRSKGVHSYSGRYIDT